MSKINTASNTLNTKGISSCIFLTKNVNVGQHSLVCFFKPLWVSADGFLKGGLLSNMHKGKITLTNWCSFYRGFGFTFQRTSVWILVFLCIINQIKESQVLKRNNAKMLSTTNDETVHNSTFCLKKSQHKILSRRSKHLSDLEKVREFSLFENLKMFLLLMILICWVQLYL